MILRRASEAKKTLNPWGLREDSALPIWDVKWDFSNCWLALQCRKKKRMTIAGFKTFYEVSLSTSETGFLIMFVSKDI